MLTIYNGSLCGEPVPFRAWSCTVAGNAIFSRPDDRKRLLDDLAGIGCQMVRLHHPARNISDDELSLYQPTYDDCRAAFPDVRAWMDDLHERGMKAWLTAQHRQRVDESHVRGDGLRQILFGKRPSGIKPGEIHDLFFWFEEALDIVDSWVEEVANEFGWHPALGLFTLVNEKLCVRSKFYIPSQRRNDPDPNPYQVEWYRLLDWWQSREKADDRTMKRPDIERFMSDIGVERFRVLREAARHNGVLCPIGSSTWFGNTTMSGLPELAVGDFIDIHLYGDAWSPDPLMEGPGEHRSLSSVIAALSVAGKPPVIGEWNGVQQGQKPTKLASYYGGHARTATECVRHGVPVCCVYTAHMAPIHAQPTEKKPMTYDTFKDPAALAEWRCAAKLFDTLEAPTEPAQWVQLTVDDIYGVGSGSDYKPAIVGEQEWARAGKRTQVSL